VCRPPATSPVECDRLSLSCAANALQSSSRLKGIATRLVRGGEMELSVRRAVVRPQQVSRLKTPARYRMPAPSPEEAPVTRIHFPEKSLIAGPRFTGCPASATGTFMTVAAQLRPHSGNDHEEFRPGFTLPARMLPPAQPAASFRWYCPLRQYRKMSSPAESPAS